MRWLRKLFSSPNPRAGLWFRDTDSPFNYGFLQGDKIVVNINEARTMDVISMYYGDILIASVPLNTPLHVNNGDTVQTDFKSFANAIYSRQQKVEKLRQGFTDLVKEYNASPS